MYFEGKKITVGLFSFFPLFFPFPFYLFSFLFSLFPLSLPRFHGFRSFGGLEHHPLDYQGNEDR